jgi:NAD(P)-dependent dehydrogenase (short-subunit alcohol dehydrogenase family)
MSDLHPRLHTPATAVVVTGGVSGIGFACAEALAAVGRPIALWDLDADRSRTVAAELAHRYNVATVGFGIDLRGADGIALALESTRAALPAIGGLVHASSPRFRWTSSPRTIGTT